MECTSESKSVVAYDFGEKFFPAKVNGKLNTVEFLDASRGIVKLIDKLGKGFSPLSSDINCNIEKIKKCYEKDPTKYVYIEDLILGEKSKNDELSVDALLWLRRALHFILVFFQNILNDGKEKECLQEHMTSAYSQTLEPYHGWVTRQLFKFFKSLVPQRSALFSTITPEKGENSVENLVKFLQSYIQSLSDNVHHIILFYKEHNLDSNAKV